MKNKLAIACLSILLSGAIAIPAWAETVIEKVARTGVLTAGTRKDAMPFASFDEEKQEWRGYSVDMLVLIKQQLEAELSKEITLELEEVDPATRVNKLLNREVDIVCGVTSFTWEREKFIDFSLSYGVTGTNLLVKKGSDLGSAESLKGKTIGIMENTINEQVIKLVNNEAKIVTVSNPKEGMEAVEAGKIDAFAWDGILLEALRKKSPNADNIKVVPELPYAKEGIACMLPESDSEFRDLVNFSLVKFMQGYVMGKPEYVSRLDEWFGESGLIPINKNLLLDFFRYTIDSHEQVLIEDKEQQ